MDFAGPIVCVDNLNFSCQGMRYLGSGLAIRGVADYLPGWRHLAEIDAGFDFQALGKNNYMLCFLAQNSISKSFIEPTFYSAKSFDEHPT